MTLSFNFACSNTSSHNLGVMWRRNQKRKSARHFFSLDLPNGQAWFSNLSGVNQLTLILSLTISFKGPPSKHVFIFYQSCISSQNFQHQLKSQDPHCSVLTFNHSFSDACTGSSHKSNSADPTIHDQFSENKENGKSWLVIVLNFLQLQQFYFDSCFHAFVHLLNCERLIR